MKNDLKQYFSNGKQNAHQEGVVKIKRIELFDQNIKMLNDVAIVTVQAKILGSFKGESNESEFRFTRVWCKDSDHTHILHLIQNPLGNEFQS